ncbi:MAG: hypothetical protein N2645_13695 [Clostridia bacterium]|nr:hypothetical protein [Clostridia bacterium]
MARYLSNQKFKINSKEVCFSERPMIDSFGHWLNPLLEDCE